MTDPRPYQSRAIDAVVVAFRDKRRSVLLVAPTGSGKTEMGAEIARRHIAARDSTRVAWGAHRAELVSQAITRLDGKGLLVGGYGAGSDRRVQVGSYQTWTRRQEAPDATLFVADECHHLADGVRWSDLSKAYLAGGSRILGLTATPARADGLALHGFDAIVVAAQISELQRLGYLVPLVWRGPGRVLRRGQLARSPCEAYMTHAKGRSAVVFGPHVQQCEEYTAEFRRNGVRAEFLSDKTPADQRADMLGRLDTGALDVICNVNVLTEGWDCPRVSCVIVARRCGSQPLWIQMTGRGLRPHPSSGKRDCLLIDLCGLAHTLGRPDEDREYHLEGDGITLSPGSPAAGLRRCKRCGKPLDEGEVTCSECGKDHSQVRWHSVGEQLGEWQRRYDQAKDALKPSKPALSLAGIYRKAQEAERDGKPWKAGAAEARFAAIFKRRPDAETVRMARAINASASGDRSATVREVMDMPEGDG